SGGTVDPATYGSLVTQIATALSNATDPNNTFNGSLKNKKIFTNVVSRPATCPQGAAPGFCTSKEIGQDFGDVFAQLDVGYNFDGLQSPGVARQGDPAFNGATTVLSVPNFYGAHGHDSDIPAMSATFLAAGPHIRDHKTVLRGHDIDVAPTIMS